MTEGTCIKYVVFSHKREAFLTFMGGFGEASNSWSPEPLTAIAFNPDEPLEQQINKSVLKEIPELVKVTILWSKE
jgi:hypothetical protein